MSPEILEETNPAFSHTPERLGLGLSGAHRTGKTTLAGPIAKDNDVPFVQSSAGEIAKRLGIDINTDVDYGIWLTFHEEILDVFEAEYKIQTTPFVTDRTPFDVAAYLLARVPANLSDPSLIIRTEIFVRRCFDIANKYFMAVVVIPPAINYVPAPGKPIPNRGHQDAIHLLIQGLVMDERFKRHVEIMPCDITDITERMSWIAEASRAAYSDIATHLKTLPSC